MLKFRHYDLQKQKFNSTKYYGIKLDVDRFNKRSKARYTLDLYLGQHVFVLFWGRQVY
jgi:hypothetical protein